MIKLFDFRRRAPVLLPSPPPPKVDPLAPVDLEDVIEAPWIFKPLTDKNDWASETIRNAAAIYTAQQTRRIADEVELIRRHLTRLQAVPPLDLRTSETRDNADGKEPA